VPYWGKTLWVGNSHTYEEAPETDIIPTELNSVSETHLYRDDAGDHASQLMTETEGDLISVPNSVSYVSSDDEFFLSTANLTGDATINNLMFSDDGVVFTAFPSFIPPGNLEINVSIKCN
jgi:hypothetical protein